MLQPTTGRKPKLRHCPAQPAAWLLVFVAVFALTAPSITRAAGLPDYSDAQLAEWQQRYPRGILYNFREVMLPRMDAEERRILGNVGFRFPLRIPGREPFGFAADSANRTVFMSIQSLKFLDDLSIAFAWLDRNGYSQESAYQYLTMLRNWQAPTPPPAIFQTLCVPADATDDADVDSLSQKTFSTAVVFIILHELGHIHLGHAGYDGISAAQARSNERDADVFALRMLARIGDVPLGVVNLFMTMSYLHEARTDFSSESAHAMRLAARTHPLSAERLTSFADALEASADTYSGSGLTQLEVLTTAAQIRIIARNFLDIQRLVALVGPTIRPEDLGPVRHGEKLGQACQATAVMAGAFSGLFAGSITVAGVEFDVEAEMQRTGDTVTGRSSYGLGVSQFEGTVDGETLRYRWWLAGNAGHGVLTRTSNGYEGTWGNGTSEIDGGLMRLQPK